MMCFIDFASLQTLLTLLHCQTLEEVKLSGRDMFSLKELVLNKSSQVGEVLLITVCTTYLHEILVSAICAG